MRKIKILVWKVGILLLLLAIGSSGACFERNRTDIIDLLAHPNRIWKGIEQNYAVTKSSWERSDLSDGTPRWMALSKNLYAYELIGSPPEKATLFGDISNETEQIRELMVRSVLLMRAVGMSEEKALEAFETLVYSAVKDRGQEYHTEIEGIRVEMIFHDTLPMLFLTLKSLEITN